MRKTLFAALACAAILAGQRAAFAHGYVGNRFFPATVTTDDPLVTDELAIPILSLSYSAAADDAPPTRAWQAGFEFDKVIIPKLAIGVSESYQWQKPLGQQRTQGWENTTLSLKYEVWRNEPHEAVVSIGLETDLGGTGSLHIGRDSFTTFTPTLYFGKGFGDLPETISLLRPLALTGTLGLSMPTQAAAPNALEWGLSLQYQIPYLQQHVRDLGIPAPFKNMIPLVEFSMESPLNRGQGKTTGTINPGVLWESRYLQVGVEALIPVNRDSGDHVGGMITLEIYIDDLFPKIFGHPIFGE